MSGVASFGESDVATAARWLHAHDHPVTRAAVAGRLWVSEGAIRKRHRRLGLRWAEYLARICPPAARDLSSRPHASTHQGSAERSAPMTTPPRVSRAEAEAHASALKAARRTPPEDLAALQAARAERDAARVGWQRAGYSALAARRQGGARAKEVDALEAASRAARAEFERLVFEAALLERRIAADRHQREAPVKAEWDQLLRSRQEEAAEWADRGVRRVMVHGGATP